MTLSLPAFRKSSGVLLAVAYTALTFGTAITPVAAEARDGATHYRAELAQPTTKTLEIIRGTPWQCKGTVCVAPKAGSRPVNVCKAFVREFGEVATFTVKGEALAEDKMAKCQPA